MKHIYTTLAIFSGVVVMLHVWGTIQPSHWNWGFHFFAFYPLLLSALILIASLLLFIPAVQKKIHGLLEKLVNTLSKHPTILVFIFLCSLLVGAAYLFPARLHLLGDGALLLRVISGIRVMDELPPNFNHQPIVGYVFQVLTNMMKSEQSMTAEDIFRLIDIAGGIIFLVLLFLFLRHLSFSPTEKVLSGCFIFFAAGSQFFLGYVELYVLLYVATFAYLVSAWFTLEKKITVLIPLISFGLMCGLHFGSVLLAPSLLILFYFAFKSRKVEVSVISVGIVVAVGIVLWIKRAQLPSIVENFLNEASYNFLPFFEHFAYFPYTMFSFHHAVDWANAHLLIAPFGIIIAVTLLIVGRKNIKWKNPTLLFYFNAALFGLLITFVLNPALGLARDWDFLASYFIPLIVFDVVLLKLFLQHKEFKAIFTTIVALTFLHWIGWIGTNASEERHIKRMLLLNDQNFLAIVPRLNYYETLGNFYWHRGDYQHSRTYWEQYAKNDSNNPRTITNLSEVYRKLGDTEKSFELLKRAADLNSPNPAVYMNLGVMYAQRYDTALAIALNERAVKMDPNYAKAHANLGLLMIRQGNYETAAVHLTKALNLGLQEPFLYREAGSAYFFLNQFETALACYDKYLELTPQDTDVRSIRNQLKALIEKQK